MAAMLLIMVMKMNTPKQWLNINKQQSWKSISWANKVLTWLLCGARLPLFQACKNKDDKTPAR
jgi:hypothetical protein